MYCVSDSKDTYKDDKKDIILNMELTQILKKKLLALFDFCGTEINVIEKRF